MPLSRIGSEVIERSHSSDDQVSEPSTCEGRIGVARKVVRPDAGGGERRQAVLVLAPGGDRRVDGHGDGGEAAGLGPGDKRRGSPPDR